MAAEKIGGGSPAAGAGTRPERASGKRAKAPPVPGLDLLGDPVPANFGRRGRPQHLPTQRNRLKLRLLLAFGHPDPFLAAALRITVPTLRKHYFRELRQRDEARPALQAERLALVYEAAAGGNVGAMRELGRLIDRDELARPGAVASAPAPKPEKLGKKAAAEAEALTAHEDSGWSGLLN